MNICIAAATVSRGKGGIERLVSIWSQFLVDQGHTITLFIRDIDKNPPCYPIPAICSLEYYDNFAEESIDILAERCIPYHFDVILAPFSWAEGLFWIKIGKKINVPLCYSEHGAPSRIEKYWSKEGRLEALSFADTIHLLLPEYLASIPHNLQYKVSIIPNSHNMQPILQKREHAEPKIILSVGRLSIYPKGNDFLINAFSLLAQDFPDWQVYMYGEGVDRLTLENLCKEKGLQDRIFMPGNMDDLVPMYNRADLFCLPSVSEGFPVVLPEAMAHALPCVGFGACPGVNSIIKNGYNGLLAPSMTAESLADTLRQYMINSDLRIEHGKNALQEIQKYSPKTILPQLEDLLFQTATSKEANAINSQPKTFAMQVSYLFEGRGGIERFCVVLAEYLLKRGHKVHFFCLTLKGKDKPGYALDPRIQVHMHTIVNTSEYRKQMRKLIQECKIDVFLTTISNSNDFFWPSVLAETGIPFLASEYTNPWVIEQEKWTRNDRLSVFALADKCNMLLKSYLVTIPFEFRKKITQIPNPLAIQKQNISIHRKKRIIAVGRFQEQVKQQSFLIKAFALLTKQFPDWQCIWFGDGVESERKFVEQLIKAHGLETQFFMPGIVTDIATELESSEIFCIPSRYEGLPNALIEAMACALPCVGFSDCSGVNELIIRNETGLLAPEMSVQSLADTLAELMNDADKRRRMGERAQDYAQQFSAEKVLPQWEEALLKCAERKGHTLAQSLLASEDIMAESALIELCSREKLTTPVSTGLLIALRNSLPGGITAPLRHVFNFIRGK